MRLAAQARAGAEWALAALVARYQPPVLRYLARLTGNAAQAHRLAERIFVRMERRLRGPRGAEHLRLWLLRAATEAGLDALRHPGRSRPPSRLNAPEGPRGLLTDGPSGAATDRLRAGLSKIAAITGGESAAGSGVWLRWGALGAALASLFQINWRTWRRVVRVISTILLSPARSRSVAAPVGPSPSNPRGPSGALNREGWRERPG